MHNSKNWKVINFVDVPHHQISHTVTKHFASLSLSLSASLPLCLTFLFYTSHCRVPLTVQSAIALSKPHCWPALISIYTWYLLLLTLWLFSGTIYFVLIFLLYFSLLFFFILYNILFFIIIIINILYTVYTTILNCI